MKWLKQGRKQDPNAAHFNKSSNFTNLLQETGLRDRTTNINATTSRPHQDRAETQGLNTGVNELYTQPAHPET